MSQIETEIATAQPAGGQEGRKRHDYLVARADLDRNREDILGVWRRNLAPMEESVRQKRFDWYYRNNPLGPGRAWLLMTKSDQRVVGSGGIGLRRMWVRGNPVLVGHASDFAIDEEHRSLKAGVMLQKAVLASLNEDLSLIYCLPTDKALATMRMAGYKPRPGLVRSVKVLRVGRYLSRLPRPVRTVASPLVDLALQMRSAETWTQTRGFTFREVQTFDERFDALWNRVAARSEMIGERTARILDWRYRLCPIGKYRICAMDAPGGSELAGYAIFQLDATGQCDVIDLLVDDRWLETMMVHLIRWCRSAGADSIALVSAGLDRWMPVFSRFGFKWRRQVATLTVSPTSGALSAGVPADWYYLLGDKDHN